MTNTSPNGFKTQDSAARSTQQACELILRELADLAEPLTHRDAILYCVNDRRASTLCDISRLICYLETQSFDQLICNERPHASLRYLASRIRSRKLRHTLLMVPDSIQSAGSKEIATRYHSHSPPRARKVKSSSRQYILGWSDPRG